MRKGYEHWRTNMARSEDAIEALANGETVTKIVASDEGQPEGDYGVELHGFITGSGTIVITSEVLYRRTKTPGEETKE